MIAGLSFSELELFMVACAACRTGILVVDEALMHEKQRLSRTVGKDGVNRILMETIE